MADPNRKRRYYDQSDQSSNRNSSPNKRPYEKNNDSNQHATVVAEHYNRRENTSAADRRKSKIYFMRNFNNWTKSILIKKYLDKLRDNRRPVVLDLGCGKGGDLLKWNQGSIHKLVCTDIASTSIDQCKERYQTLRKRSRNRRVFDAEFIVADSGKELLQPKFLNPDMKLNMTSCQFVIHYTFESQEQAERMVENACANLNEGGYFVGTTVNSEALLRNLNSSEGLKFGNDIYSVEFANDESFPDYGCRYTFKLHDVVDCPEFLLKKANLVNLCRKHGMRLVEWKTFAEFFQDNSRNSENFRLLKRMSALEEYPARGGEQNSSVESDYDHARAECERISSKYPGSNPRVATLSKTEWEAASIYVVYAFVKDTNSREGDSDSEDHVSQTREGENNSEDSAKGPEKIPLVIL